MKLPRTSIFFRFLTLSLLIICVCIYWSTVAFREMNREARLEFRRQSDLLVIRILDEPGLDAPAQLKRFENLRDQTSLFALQLWIVDTNGKVLAANTTTPLPREWSEIPVAKGTHQFSYKTVTNPADPSFLGVGRLANNGQRLISLETSTSALRHLARRYAFFIATFVLFGVVVICLLVLIYLRSIGKTAEQVFGAIQRGDLQQRFPVSKINGITHVMDHFNHMADELVRLIENTRSSEHARMSILRELSHDLRTPIAAIRSLTENLSDYAGRLTADEQHNLLESAKGEIAYMQNLLDDLFFLAEMNEPKYRKNTEEIAIASLLEADMCVFNRLKSERSAIIQFELRVECDAEDTWILGDSRLIQRAFRNIFDNCARFAASTVVVTINVAGNTLAIDIQDDGRGFAAEFLDCQTHADRSRQGAAKKSLGIEIAAHIFRLHEGVLELDNARNNSGEIAGARYRVTLKHMPRKRPHEVH